MSASTANNYFRQIGATLGSAVVGSVFAGRLTNLLAQRLPAQGGAATSTNSLTPAVVAGLPEAVRAPVVSSYNDALTPIFLWIVPLALVAALLLCFVREKDLATSLERVVESEAVGEGEVLVPPPAVGARAGRDASVPPGDRIRSAADR